MDCGLDTESLPDDFDIANAAAVPAESTSSSMEETPMALLPPDHVLLQPFQRRLREYLLRTKNQLSTELSELKHEYKMIDKQRDNVGAKLFDMQKELKYQNEQLQEFSKDIHENIEKRRSEEASVEKLKVEVSEKTLLNKEQKALYNQRMSELEQTQTLENNIRQWSDEVEDEVKNAKRIVSRDAQLQKQLSEEKKKSDLLFYHLDVEVKKREREMETLRNEFCAVRDVNEALNMSIADANSDLEVLQKEHKRLTQAWGEVIVAINHRDKIMCQLNQDLDKQKQKIKLCNSGIEAIKKLISKELELNEKLANFKTRLKNDFLVVQRDCQKQSDILLALESKLNLLPQWLEQTEADWQEAKKEGTALEVEVRRIQWKIDKQSDKKFQLEEGILKIAQEQLITDKASEYRLKLLRDSQEKRRGVELKLAQAQTQLSGTLLNIERHKGNITRQRKVNEDLNDRLQEVETRAKESQSELNMIQQQIDTKLKQIDKLSRKLEEIQRFSEATGSVPIELKIKEVEKAVQAIEHQVMEHQQFWLTLQNHFLNLNQKRNAQLKEVQIANNQYTIMQAKACKIDSEIEVTTEETRVLNNKIKALTSKIDFLNLKRQKSHQRHITEENECECEHSEMVERLREHEFQVLQLESEINELQGEIETYKDIVLDKHREALSWETKYKLIEETLRWRRQESQAGAELVNMRTEIHRMNIRYNQLKRAQEKLIQDFDHCVMHREQIFTIAMTKRHFDTDPKRVNPASTMQQKIIDMRYKLKQIQMAISELEDHKLVEVCREQERINIEVDRIEGMVEEEKKQDERITEKFDEAVLVKIQNLESIVRKQNRARSYRRVGTTTHVAKTPRSETILNAQSQKHNEFNDILMDIIQALMTQFPERRNFWSKIQHLLRD